MLVLAEKREIKFGAARTIKTPLLVPSFSSRVPEIEKPFRASEQFIDGPILISAYDVKHTLLLPPYEFGSAIFLDSGGSAALICDCAEQCRTTAFAGFKNGKKIDAIVQTAELLNGRGFTQFKQEILKDPIQALQSFPFIGPITAFHLAKNLGFTNAKPDRHLQRMAQAMGYSDGHHLCRALANATGDPIQVVDIVLWRYSEQRLQDS